MGGLVDLQHIAVCRSVCHWIWTAKATTPVDNSKYVHQGRLFCVPQIACLLDLPIGKQVV